MTPPSDSERPSSTSTVWVMASLPFGSGCAAAGAMVSVGAPPAVDETAAFRSRQPARRRHITIRSDSVAVFLTNSSFLGG